MLIQYKSYEESKDKYKPTRITVTSDEGEELDFRISVIFNQSLKKYDIFQYLNEYLSTTPKEFRDKLWTYYKTAHELFSQSLMIDDLHKELSLILCSILDSFKLEDVCNWFDANMVRLKLMIPDNCMESYDIKVEDNRGTREQTYLVRDYKELVGLVLILRSIVPIWSEYADMSKASSVFEFKEMRMVELIAGSSFFYIEPFEKLKTYIKYNLKPDNYVMPQYIIRGINSSIFFEWLLALIVVKRLCTKDIEAREAGKNLITYVHQYIIQRVDPNQSLAKQIHHVDKPATDDKGIASDSAKDKASSLEIYKQKQDVAQGEIVEIEYSISDNMRCAERLCFTIDHNLVERCIETARQLRSFSLSEPQITLLKWVYASIVSPRGIPYVSKNKIIDALGVTQAVLWSRGHKYLALLATCYNDISGEIMSINPIDSKTKVPKEMIDKVNELYPFSKIRKKDTVSNMVIKSISDLSDKFSSIPWKYTASKEMVDEICPNTVNGILPIKLELKILLTKLVIEIGSRNF